MFSLLFLVLVHAFLSQAAILECDFETVCNDFVLDSNWGLTDGLHPQPVDHDHTLDNSSGHYLFYNPSGERFQDSVIKTADWLEAPRDRAVCFRMWYFTPRANLPFYVQLVQGDDEGLVRVVASVPGKAPSINDWTLVNVTLPSEKFKIFIRLNVTARPLAFDDFSVDYCDAPAPSPPESLYQCDFESACSNDFVSLSLYPYQWSILQASEAVRVESQAPPVDYTFSNSSGHYALLPNQGSSAQGKVGYLHLQREWNITSEASFCLNFQYYSYGRSYLGTVKVYRWVSNTSGTVQRIWPNSRSSSYVYPTNTWTWGIINLPVGEYTLLFRVDSSEMSSRSFTLDNIAVTSCAYSPTELGPYDSLLSFACTFDDMSTCDMVNANAENQGKQFNFTVYTGETVPKEKLGPTRDHTTNSTTGGFLYWDQRYPFTANDYGRIYQSISIEQNLGTCVKFAYYVKSAAVKKNGTILSVSAGGCYGTQLWSQALDDSEGWQTAIVPVLGFACGESFYFDVYQPQPIDVSVAFDDIEVDQCSSLIPTTTTTTTSTSTSTTKTTVTPSTSRTSAQTTFSSTLTTTTTTTMISTTTSRPTTTTGSGAHQSVSSSGYFLILFCLLGKLSS